MTLAGQHFYEQTQPFPINSIIILVAVKARSNRERETNLSTMSRRTSNLNLSSSSLDLWDVDADEPEDFSEELFDEPTDRNNRSGPLHNSIGSFNANNSGGLNNSSGAMNRSFENLNKSLSEDDFIHQISSSIPKGARRRQENNSLNRSGDFSKDSISHGSLNRSGEVSLSSLSRKEREAALLAPPEKAPTEVTVMDASMNRSLEFLVMEGYHLGEGDDSSHRYVFDC